MFPVLLFADHVPRTNRISGDVGYSCVVRWPNSHAVVATRAYITYTAVVGFVCPLTAIVAFYSLLVCRLRFTRRHIRSRDVRRFPAVRDATGRHVVNVVTVIVFTYIVCWLPYWSFQVRASPLNPIYTKYIRFLLAIVQVTGGRSIAAGREMKFQSAVSSLVVHVPIVQRKHVAHRRLQ